MSFINDILFCLKPRCPVCQRGLLFKPMSITVRDVCDECQENLGAHDIGDGAAVFLTFILGFSVIPLAWVFEIYFAWPLWVHAVVWTVVSLAMILALLPATKAYIILLEYRHLKRKED